MGQLQIFINSNRFCLQGIFVAYWPTLVNANIQILDIEFQEDFLFHLLSTYGLVVRVLDFRTEGLEFVYLMYNGQCIMCLLNLSKILFNIVNIFILQKK